MKKNQIICFRVDKNTIMYFSNGKYSDINKGNYFSFKKVKELTKEALFFFIIFLDLSLLGLVKNILILQTIRRFYLSLNKIDMLL